LRPGFLLAKGSCPEHPGLKSETWATHSKSGDRSFISDRPNRTFCCGLLATTTYAFSFDNQQTLR
jgi:hypothetical protein